MNWQRFVGRKSKDAELAEEIESHLAHDEDLRTARGVDADEARRQARVKFGSQNAVRAEEWRYRSLPWVDVLDGAHQGQAALAGGRHCDDVARGKRRPAGSACSHDG
jgi:hypothetical protein